MPKGNEKKESVEIKVKDFVPTMEASGIDDVLSKLDEKKIQAAEKKLSEAKEKLAKKVYAVKFESEENIKAFQNFMNNSAEWREKEALGVIEICKILEKLQKGEVKENILYMGALPIEASHYFLSKTSGRGLREAESFISILKPISQALESVKTDASEVQSLEKELSAAQQGLELG
jgi:CRISPR/Cas system CSM-associated protein Csm2 small subunit